MTVAIAAAWESEDRWALPELSLIELHTRAAVRALSSCGLGRSDVDGLACGTAPPHQVADQLGIDPDWTDGTSLPSVATLLHLRHAHAAIASGSAQVVLIVHAESHRSRVGVDGIRSAPLPSSLAGQFDAPTGIVPAGRYALGLRRYMEMFDIDDAQLAEVAVAEREWAGLTPGAMYRDPITVEDVLRSPMIVEPLRRLLCGATTDNAGALVVTSLERARDLTDRPVILVGSSESYDAALASQVRDPHQPSALRRSFGDAFGRAGISWRDLDHLMVFDGFAHGVLYALDALGFGEVGGAASFVAEGATRPGGRLPTNTNGGFLNYRHGEMAQVQEAVRQLRSTGPVRVRDAEISAVQGAGQSFGSAAVVVLSVRSG